MFWRYLLHMSLKAYIRRPISSGVCLINTSIYHNQSVKYMYYMCLRLILILESIHLYFCISVCNHISDNIMKKFLDTSHAVCYSNTFKDYFLDPKYIIVILLEMYNRCVFKNLVYLYTVVSRRLIMLWGVSETKGSETRVHNVKEFCNILTFIKMKTKTSSSLNRHDENWL